jgi:hypothetical protein
MSKIKSRFKIVGAERICEVEGQEARTLVALHGAGDVGVTALEVSTWALRLAHYVMKLKKLGLTIETVREKHAGPVPGWHGRYILRSHVEVLETSGVPA